MNPLNCGIPTHSNQKKEIEQTQGAESVSATDP